MPDSSFDIKITTTGNPAGAESVAKSLQGVGKAASSAAVANKELAAKGDEATSTIDALGKKGSAAKDVYEGLSGTLNGGAGAIFNISKAWSNFGESLRANPVGTGLAIALASLGLVKKGFDYLAESTERANQKLFGTGQKTAEAAAQMDTLAKSAVLAADALKQTAADAASEWERLGKAMDDAQHRSDALKSAQLASQIAGVDLEEASALASAKPADRDAIKRSFDRKRTGLRAAFDTNALESSDLQAQNEKRNAQQEIVNARSAVVNASITSADKSGALAQAEQEGREALKTRNTDLIAEASLRVLTARKESELADKNLAYARAAAAPTIASATERIRKANETIELNQIKRPTLITSQLAENKTQANEETLGSAKEEMARIAIDARRIAERAPGVIRPDVYQPNFSLSGDAQKAERERIESGNAQRYFTLDHSVTAIKAITDKLGDGKNDAKDLADLVAAIEELVKATQTTESGTIRNLISRVKNLESQQRNGDRSP